MSWLKIITTCLVFTLAAAVTTAQSVSCLALVERVVSAGNADCAGLERNTACYASAGVSVTPRTADTALPSAETGAVVALADIAALQTVPLTAEAQEWGVAVLALQASLPETQPDQNLAVVLFGEAHIEDTRDVADAVPMQAFRLESGVAAPPCVEAPASGMLIQTPSGVGNVALSINGVQVQLGSTAVVRAVAGGSLRFTILEGFASLTVTEGSDALTVLPFKTAVVMLDADGLPTGTALVEDALAADWAALPLGLLPREVTTPPAEGGVTPYSMTFTPPIGSTSDATVLAGQWSYETIAVDASACPGGSGEIGATGTLRLTPAADGTFRLFDAGFTFDGSLWRGTNTETVNGIEVHNAYEIAFTGETATAILSSDVRNSPIGPCIITWTATMAYLGQ